MRLSDIKGKKAMTVMADILELADILADEPQFSAFMDGLKHATGKTEDWRLFCAVAPVMRNEAVQDKVVSIVAAAKGIPEEQAAEECDLVGEIVELLTSDIGSLGFFASSAQTGD